MLDAEFPFEMYGMRKEKQIQTTFWEIMHPLAPKIWI